MGRSLVTSLARTAEFHCGGLEEGIITATGVIMMDKTGWSSSISAARLTE
jgi:hypothetical protein